MPSQILSNASELIKKLREERSVRLQFLKKDGTERLMNATLNFNRIPKTLHPKDFKAEQFLDRINKTKTISVFDTDKNEWRSVPIEKVKIL